MIKAIELRIGDYVRDKISNEWMTVDEIGKKVGAVLINREKYPLPKGWEMDAIPLTPEILEKCGFEPSPSSSSDVFRFGDFEYGGAPNLCTWKDKFIDAEIKFLHQLQNLYFALTGEELEVKL